MYSLTHRGIHVTVRRYNIKNTDQKGATVSVFFTPDEPSYPRECVYRKMFVTKFDKSDENTSTDSLVKYAMSEIIYLNSHIRSEYTQHMRLQALSVLYYLEYLSEKREKRPTNRNLMHYYSDLTYYIHTGEWVTREWKA